MEKGKSLDKIKSKYNDVKKFTSEVAVPKVKERAIDVKNKVSKKTSDISNKVKNTLTEEQMVEILNTLYIKSIDGIPKVSVPVNDLVKDYMSKNDSTEKAVKSLINNSSVKCGTSGFLTSFGGFITLPVTLPANITSVMYVQLRMCVAIAAMAGYDIHSDQVQTLIYVCLTGSAASDILKSAGIQFTNKFGVALVKKIPGKTLTAINKKVGFRFLTKFGEHGLINLHKVVPVVGGIVGGGIDIASTRIIGNNAYKIFIKNEMPSKADDKKMEEKEFKESSISDLDDIDTKTYKEAIKEK